jgi:integrase/recombinase XerD
MNIQRLTQGYKEWMQTIGYHSCTISSHYGRIKNFLHYVKQQKAKGLQDITPEQIQAWYKIKKQMIHPQTGKQLSASTLNHHQCALRLFSSYLYHTGQGSLDITLHNEPVGEHHRSILTKEEITQLYTVAENSDKPLQDKILLHLYYSCGLRRNEGIRLNIQDIFTDKGILYISKGKGYTDRYIPLPDSLTGDFTRYLNTLKRNSGQRNNATPLLQNETGKRVYTDYPGRRLKKLITATENQNLIEKSPGLHSLRHSIATHLLQNGMDIELISKLLGHAYLDTTQIYTHLVEC